MFVVCVCVRACVRACVCVFLLCVSVLRARVTQIFFVARVDLVVSVRNACVHAWVSGCVRLCACVQARTPRIYVCMCLFVLRARCTCHLRISLYRGGEGE